MFLSVVSAHSQFISDGDSVFCIEKSFSSFDTSRLMLNGMEFYRLSLSDCERSFSKPSFPDLPEYVTLLSFPYPYNLIVEEKILESDTVDLEDNVKIQPSQVSQSKKEISTSFLFDDKCYSQNSYLSDSHSRIEKKGLMGGFGIYTLHISPFRYNPGENKLIFAKKVKLKIKSSFRKEDNIKRVKRVKVLENFLYDKVFVKKYQDEEIVNQPYSLCIIAPDSYSETLQNFIAWKKQQGFNVTELYTSLIGTTKEEIKTYLQSVYDEEGLQPFDYLLICGDVEQIPSFAVSSPLADEGVHYTDLYYAEYTNDFLPDIFYGRISARDTAELKNIMDKIIAYEKYDFSDDSYLDNSLLIAGYDYQNSVAKYTNGQTNYVKDYISSLSDTSVFYSPNSLNQKDEILSLIENSNSWVNYTGHCDIGKWSLPDISSSDISFLNTGKYSLFINNCCLSGKYDEQECFAESLLRVKDGGAVACIAASDYTMWKEDYIWAVGNKSVSLHPLYSPENLGLYDRFFHTHGEARVKQSETLGQMLLGGALSVMKSNSVYSDYYFEVYNIQGDPTLIPYVGRAKETDAHFDEIITLDSNYLRVITEPYTYLCLSQNADIISVASADSNGYGVLQLSSLADTGKYILTQTHRFFKPRVDTIEVISPKSSYITVDDIKIKDAQTGEIVNFLGEDRDYIISLKIKNLGKEDFFLDNNFLKLDFGGAKSRDIILESNLIFFNSVPALHTTVIDEAFRFKTSASLENGKKICFNFSLNSGDELIRERKIYVYSHTPQIDIDNFELSVYADTIRLSFDLLNRGKSTAKEGELIVNNVKDTDISPLEPMQARNITLYFSSEDYADWFTSLITYKSNAYEVSKFLAVNLFPDIETFESDLSLSSAWLNDEKNPWITDKEVSHSGLCSMRSPLSLRSNESSSLCLSIENLISDSVGFYAKVSSEEYADMLTFSVDGEVKLSLSGEKDWDYYSFSLSRGKHILSWTYSKNDWLIDGEDAAWIDDVTLPHYGEISVGEEEVVQQSFSNIKIYPNPAEKEIRLENIITSSDIYIYDERGRLRLHRKNLKENENIDLFFLESGLYNIILLKNNKPYFSERFIVNKN